MEPIGFALSVLDRAEKRIQELTVDAPSPADRGDDAADGGDEDVPF